MILEERRTGASGRIVVVAWRMGQGVMAEKAMGWRINEYEDSLLEGSNHLNNKGILS